MTMLELMSKVLSGAREVCLADWPEAISGNSLAGSSLQPLGDPETHPYSRLASIGHAAGPRVPKLTGRGLLILLALGLLRLTAAEQNPATAASTPLQIGNFLADGGAWTSMTLMSDYLHNGVTPDRQASDLERAKIIRRARSFGNTIHLYGTNDDNYSRRRGAGIPGWQDIPDRRLFFHPDDFRHWRHWFVECRKAGLEIVLWLWPNDARESYNNPKIWTDAMVLVQMKRLLDFGSTSWQGRPLVSDFVLKLETDDEWDVPRINRIARAARAMLPSRARLWYHNQSTDPSLLKAVDWSSFDGIRYQFKMRSDRAAVQRELKTQIDALPPKLLWVGSEYTVDGQSAEARQFGDWILDMKAHYPVIIGVDNSTNRMP